MDATKIKETIASLRSAAKSHKAHSKEWRETQLHGIKRMMKEEESRILEICKSDLGRSEAEARSGEISPINVELSEAIKNFSTWMKPVSVSTPMVNVKGLSSSTIQPTPLGLVLIISPWNYPLNLCIIPLIGAIAAGNCVLIKPSELAPATSHFLAEVIPKYLDGECIKVIEGAVDETTEILKHQFDHIFYTGNPAVGRIVMRAASQFLTPVTLELGGKNPTFVDRNLDLQVSARRVIWGKIYNCGQTCLAPDYVLVQRDFEDKFIQEMMNQLKGFYGDVSKIQDNQDYGRIITKRHVDRIKSYFEDVDPEKIVTGGPSTANSEERFFPPTIIRGVTPDMKIMQEEIFGPVLAVVPIDNFEDALEFVKSRPHPLALYVFTNDARFKNNIITETQSGSVVVNDCILQFVQSSLPFGGVGESGMGAYHGKKSFETFSHMRSVLDKTVWFDLNLRYPPYTESKINQSKWLS